MDGSLVSVRKKKYQKRNHHRHKGQDNSFGHPEGSPRTSRPSPDTGYTAQSWAPEPNLHRQTKYTKRKDSKQEAKGW